jgi:nitrate reductase (NAD(P)H)
VSAANIKKREKEEEAQKKQKAESDEKDGKQNGDDANGDTEPNGKQKGGDANGDTGEDPEHDWRRGAGHEETKHHDAYNSKPKNGDEKTNGHETEYQRLLKKYTPQEISLLRSLQHEAQHMQNLKQNPGTLLSPMSHKAAQIETSIDGVDAQTPDNWIARSPHMIRRTGQHPMNSEAELSVLYDAGLITPNRLHYVRNHGAVPRLYWEEHILDVCDGALRLRMEDLRSGNWESVNIPVLIACDGNRRGELNRIRKSKGFDWGPGAIGCAYWRGVRVADVLQSAGVEVKPGHVRRWVNFAGADDPSEGKYETCFPLEYIMDPTNDVLLAYEMNDQPLPPDHGFPVRLVVPGYVGGRSVKWLAKIWVSDKENDSYYHIW